MLNKSQRTTVQLCNNGPCADLQWSFHTTQYCRIVIVSRSHPRAAVPTAVLYGTRFRGLTPRQFFSGATDYRARRLMEYGAAAAHESWRGAATIVVINYYFSPPRLLLVMFSYILIIKFIAYI